MHHLVGLRILVVDDSPEMRFLVALLFEAYAADVRTCESAAEALVAVLEWKPDVIVSDISMPEHDGYWLMEKLRHLEPESGGTTPAIAITAQGGVDGRRRALEAGFRFHMQKPFEPEDLLTLVESLAESCNRARHRT